MSRRQTGMKDRRRAEQRLVDDHLTPAQQKALRMAYHDEHGLLSRVSGGFWTSGTLARECQASGSTPSGVEWYVPLSTVRALEDRGLLERAGDFQEDWRESRRITDRGREVADTGGC